MINEIDLGNGLTAEYRDGIFIVRNQDNSLIRIGPAEMARLTRKMGKLRKPGAIIHMGVALPEDEA